MWGLQFDFDTEEREFHTTGVTFYTLPTVARRDITHTRNRLHRTMMMMMMMRGRVKEGDGDELE